MHACMYGSPQWLTRLDMATENLTGFLNHLGGRRKCTREPVPILHLAEPAFLSRIRFSLRSRSLAFPSREKLSGKNSRGEARKIQMEFCPATEEDRGGNECVSRDGNPRNASVVQKRDKLNFDCRATCAECSLCVRVELQVHSRCYFLLISFASRAGQ